MMDFNLIPLLPVLFLAISSMGLLMVGAFVGNDSTKAVSWASVAALMIAAVILVTLSWHDALVLGGMFRFDDFTGVYQILIIIGLIASLLLSMHYLEQENAARFEYPILILLAGIGMMLMAGAYNFLALYMALELQSLSLYVLAAFMRNSTRSAESGVKYFALGAISSGMILFGISMIYGFTGSIDYGVITATLTSMDAPNMGVIFGLAFILAGLAFKISAAPFHMWTPDVYQGAPGSVTALFAIVPKVAAMAMIMRVLFTPFSPLYDEWLQIIWFLSVASMVVGAFGAIAQDNIKRLFAYSSIGNMGYALIGIAAGSEAGIAAVTMYMTIYLVMTAGAFGVVLSMRRGGRALENISDLAGLSRTAPVMAYIMAILMFSMSGIPPLAGFFGKLIVFQAAVEKGLIVLGVIGVLTSVVGAYYYLRIIKVMFFDEPAPAFDKGLPLARVIVLAVSVIFVLAFILKPDFVLNHAQIAAAALFAG